MQTNTTRPFSDTLNIDLKAPRLSVEYAKARGAIQQDFAINMNRNQALAKRQRKEDKRKIISIMEGKVSKNAEGHYIVTFPDFSVARL